MRLLISFHLASLGNTGHDSRNWATKWRDHISAIIK